MRKFLNWFARKDSSQALIGRLEIAESLIQHLQAKVLELERTKLSADGIGSFIDKQNALHVAMDAQVKLEAMANALGIAVVSNPAGEEPGAVIVNVRDNGLLGRASEYINMVALSGELLSAQRRVFSHYVQIAHALNLTKPPKASES